MRPTKIAAALAAALLSAPAAAGADHGATGHDHTGPAHDPVPESNAGAVDEGSFRGTVIERTLGDEPAPTIVVPRGAAVRLVLNAPAGTELHLHGYDLVGTAAPGAPIVMTFRADHLGRFPIEAHGVKDVLGRAEKALAYVEVRPE